MMVLCAILCGVTPRMDKQVLSYHPVARGISLALRF